VNPLSARFFGTANFGTLVYRYSHFRYIFNIGTVYFGKFTLGLNVNFGTICSVQNYVAFIMSRLWALYLVLGTGISLPHY